MKKKGNVSAEHIIKEAVVLLQQSGVRAFTFRLLAKRVGCSEEMLYRYFVDLRSLFTAVIRTYATRHLTQAVSEITDPVGPSLQGKLMRFGVRLLLVMRDDDNTLDIYRCVISDASHTDIGLLFSESGLREALEKLTFALDSAMMRKELRLADPRVMSQQLFSLLYVTFWMRLLERAPQPLTLFQIRRLVQDAVKVFLYGVSRPC
ncbi:TetR/AcrR family transcriptional regulator (plasmid) [Klebsiella pneumoniae]|uniref:TetR/AcrR family transcriptional regulator n=1 Tax=Klebsiella pneumoniae TaxID=573 RepID=UPI001CFF51B0|nr:TetR/AcrR family transcriptional regulator [Klebsiella pneumoniae]UDC36735.1 TetR/AcrR family transcriptional regulator [Klebsiella pneumoniae]